MRLNFIPNKKRMKNIRTRVLEMLSIPTAILAGVLIRTFLSFTSWIRAILLTWGVVDGFASNYLYKEEKFFPYQFLRYARIVANMAGVFTLAIPIVWNIGDGLYSLYIYRNSHAQLEHMSRYGRILNGALLAVF